MTSDYKFLHYDVSEGIASIKLDRPVNAIHEAMMDEYFDALDHADRDDAVKVIVLSGEGKGLSAGADLKYLAGFGTDEMARFLEKFYIEQVERVRGLSKPIIAAVHGYARKVPARWPSHATVVASDDLSFGIQGAQLAAPPGMHVWHHRNHRANACGRIDPDRGPDRRRRPDV